MSNYTITNKSLDKNKVFILQKGEIHKRFDPFFYVPELLELEKRIVSKNPNTLRNFVKSISSGATPSRDEEDKYYSTSENGIPFLRVQNITQYGLDLSDVKFINKETHNSLLKRSQVEEDDLLVTITGRIASSAVAPKGFIGNINQHSVVIKTHNRETSELLACYLNTTIGQKLANRLATGGTRLALDYPALLSIPIIVNNKILDITKKVILQKEKNEASSENLLNNIETYLLNELGIILPEKLENTLRNRMFTTSISELSGSRFDPNYHINYFHKVFQSIENGKYEYSKMNQYASFQAGYAFKSSDYVEQSECSLITIKNIKKNEIDLNNVTFLPNDFYELFKDFQINKNDLLIAMTGATIGKVGIYNHINKALLNQRNGIIKPNNLNSIYLLSILNLKIYQEIILRNSNGGAQPNISETDIMKISIPVPPLEKQIEIADHISAIRKQAQDLKDQTKVLLEKTNKEIEDILLNT
ncbi:MAG: restriction endonuclease subunit S [Lutibacter sp.]|uniref:restriction endonuclease subunit S n=1 Tax=Lutibacter sp. TaxID=1925666 RepID=UPI00385E7A59